VAVYFKPFDCLHRAFTIDFGSFTIDFLVNYWQFETGFPDYF